MTKKQFIAKLKRARRIAEAGETHCSTVPYCHHCALDTVGIFNGPGGYTISGGDVADGYWSFKKTKEEVLALFDNSIKALEAEVQ